MQIFEVYQGGWNCVFRGSLIDLRGSIARQGGAPGTE